MLEEVRIRHFQSHEDTVLRLHPGVNSLEGDSDSGKTAIVRALRFCTDNASRGIVDASFWVQNRDGDDILRGEECSVTVTMDGGKSVTRKRTQKFNGYVTEVGGRTETYEACRKDVPKDVTDLFNLSAVNSQRQEEGPFFLSDAWTPGARARYVNSLVKLDDIDRAIQACSAMARENSARRKVCEEELAAAEALAGLTSDADNLPGIVEGMDEDGRIIDELRDVPLTCNRELSERERGLAVVESLTPMLDGLERLSAAIQADASGRSEAEETLGHLERSIGEREGLSRVAASAGDVPSLDEAVADVESLDRAMGRLASVCNGRGDERERAKCSRLASMDVVQLQALLDGIAEDAALADSLRGTVASVDGDFLSLDSAASESGDAEREYDCITSELSTMACPVCGHVGCEC